VRTLRVRQPVWAWLLIFNLAAAFYSVGAAWLAQLNWQLWRFVGATDFDAYHRAWWYGIWWAIFPIAALAFLGVCAQVRWRSPNVPALDHVGRACTAGPYLLWHGPVVGTRAEPASPDHLSGRHPGREVRPAGR
jgi:hypothetical protein